MTVFLDVGAHEGQTLEEVSKHHYGFTAIHAFEPMPTEFARLQERWGRAKNIHLYPFGLADRTGPANIYGDNINMGASLYSAKRDVDPAVVTPAYVVRATDWLTGTVPAGEELVVKLNCEGAEVPILSDLCDSGAIHRITHLLIDFDIRKVTDAEHQEELVIDKMRTAEFDRYVLAETVMHGHTHQDRIAAWLRTIQ